MQQLGINAIRVYNVDANIDHNQCVSIFNAAGIYMILDVNSGLYGQYIDRSNPSSTYNEAYLSHVFEVIETFAGYPNLLGFWAANEIINQDSTADAPAYIRAVVRDMKDYIAKNIPRPIGVGYAAADVSTLLSDTWNYLACEDSSSPSSKIDFFGLNDYEWCGDSSYTVSGYDKLVTMFSDASIPVFFSEYGCNKVEPRTFTEVAALYGVNMTSFSGGFVYEWTQEDNDYGLVAVNSSTDITILNDYGYLKQEFASVNVKSLAAEKTAAATASTCNTASVTGSAFPTGFSIPARPSGVDSMISSGVIAAKGSIVSVTATTMPATVHNYTGTTAKNLKLVELACNEINAPGLAATYTSSSASCSYTTGSATGGAAGTSKGTSGSKSDATSHFVLVDVRWAVYAASAIFVLAVML